MADRDFADVSGTKKNYKTPQSEILPLSQTAREYLTTVRKFEPETLDVFRIGSGKNSEIIIPFYDEKDVLSLIKFRHEKGEMLHRKRKTDDGYEDYKAKTVIEPNGKPILFGSHLADASAGALVICFGDYDAMSVSQDGVPNCVSLPFGDKGFGFLDLQWSFIESFPEIILYPDNDTYPTPQAEYKAKAKLDELATRLGKHRVKLVSCEAMKGAKDANEILQKFGAGFNKALVENADWFPSGIVPVADFIEADAEEGVPTGLVDVDRVTCGFIGKQLIVISGDNGAGKTTEALNIAANFIEEGEPVFIWSGEQSVGKIRYWFERIIAGKMNLKTVVGDRTGFEYFFPLDDRIEAIRAWYRNFFFQLTEVGLTPEKFFNSAEIAIRRHGCRLVIIDNLMAFTGGEGETYFQAQGDFAENCKRFAEKFNVTVLLICHNKKENETAANWLPTKNSIEGSKKITNWADLVIQMYRVPETRRPEFSDADAVLLICKARESGKFEGVRLAIDTVSNRFFQMSDETGHIRQYGWEFNYESNRNDLQKFSVSQQA